MSAIHLTSPGRTAGTGYDSWRPSADTEIRAEAAVKPERWRLADIDFGGIDRAAIADDALLSKIVFLASFIETGSDLYAGNLITYFADDAELSRWLRESWQPEEVQHGHALRAYAENVWPQIDWQRRFDGFFGAYARTCTVGELEPAPALELVARCMVETGTATFYGALRNYTREPVLKDLAGRIFADEVRHYKNFYHHFRIYQQRERHPRWAVGRTLLQRLAETRSSDGYYAYRELWDGDSAAEAKAFEADYDAFNRAFTALVQRHGPRAMSIRMGLKPLGLPSPVVGWLARHDAPMYALWRRLGG